MSAGEVDKMNAKDIEPLDFLPAPTCRERFYRYSGSLTTPNCDEVVVWTVFADAIEVSNGQLESLRKAKYFSQNKNGPMVNNFRPIQPLNNRRVERSFNDSKPCSAGVRAVAIGPLALLTLTLCVLLSRL